MDRWPRSIFLMASAINSCVRTDTVFRETIENEGRTRTPISLTGKKGKEVRSMRNQLRIAYSSTFSLQQHLLLGGGGREGQEEEGSRRIYASFSPVEELPKRGQT